MIRYALMRTSIRKTKIAILVGIFAACDSTLPAPQPVADSHVSDSSIDAAPIADSSADSSRDQWAPVLDSFVDKSIIPADSNVDGPVADLSPDAGPADLTVDTTPLDATIDQTPVDSSVDTQSDAFNAGGSGWGRASTTAVIGLGTMGSFDSSFVKDPFVMLEGGIYRMWYVGAASDQVRHVGYATSTDGVNWTKSLSNPVLSPGSGAAWDDSSINGFSVVKEATGYAMYYSGGGGDDRAVGRATSTDGLNWTKYTGNPVFDIVAPGGWDDAIDGCFVLKDGADYRMWYQGADSNSSTFAIGYAHSVDGLVWQKETSAVLDKGAAGNWDDWITIAPSVIKESDGSFTMWYLGVGTGQPATGIGQAYSTDGKTWTKVPTAVFLGGAPGQWDANMIGRPFVLRYSPSELRMWYVGASAPSPSGSQIGYATTPYLAP